MAGVGPARSTSTTSASRAAATRADKADPYAFRTETPPRTASIVWDLDYRWGDARLDGPARAGINALDAPWSIYELHLGSWRRVPEDGDRSLNYRELAHALADYVSALGFTHVELMPVMEHPFYGSWGYQVTGYFAPTARYGTPQDFMYFVDHLHQRGIGVILDWVPSHFPTDAHGLATSTARTSTSTPIRARASTRSGTARSSTTAAPRCAASSSQQRAVLARELPHRRAARRRRRLDAVPRLRAARRASGSPTASAAARISRRSSSCKQLNLAVYRDHPDTQTIAEESTAWPMVSRPTYLGGLGFGLKWNMGWMHDTLEYFRHDPVHRKYHHSRLTFSLWYAFTENFVLPLSHDEVVHGKGALIGKMPGDEWQQFASLRLLFGYMWTHPGKKLLFMGGEFGQRREWHHDESLEWHVLQYPLHAGVQRWVRDLNDLYRSTPALHELDFTTSGFRWLECEDAELSVIAFLRLDSAGAALLVACNFTPVPRSGYRVGVPHGGRWRECLNSDARDYGGSGQGNLGALDAVASGAHGYPWSLLLHLPPLAVVMLAPQ